MFGSFRRPAPPVRARTASRGSAPTSSMTAADWRLLRSPPGPLDQALSRPAQAWLARLPAGVRPHALCTRYPRIANRLAVCWADPALTDLLFDDLLIDRRGGRQGFPAPVLADLLALRELHESRPRSECAEDPWSARLQASCDR